jgi:CHASE3 domain sensor protein
MKRARRFEVSALLGYAAIVFLLAIGMAIAIDRMQRVTTSQLEQIRKEELTTTLAERVRWNAELIVSTGRGYLLSGDRKLLEELKEAGDNFDKNIHSLEQRLLTPVGVALVSDVKRAANQFRSIQTQLAAERERPTGGASVVTRFENELIPARRALSRSLDRLNDHEAQGTERA